MDKKDTRMNISTEAVNNIKSLKLNAWTLKFTEQIHAKRAIEMKALRKRLCVSTANITVVHSMPQFLIMASFALYIYVTGGQDLTVSTVYTVLSVFGMIREPMRWLPFFVGLCVEFSVAMKRI